MLLYRMSEAVQAQGHLQGHDALQGSGPSERRRADGRVPRAQRVLRRRLPVRQVLRVYRGRHHGETVSGRHGVQRLQHPGGEV